MKEAQSLLLMIKLGHGESSLMIRLDRRSKRRGDYERRKTSSSTRDLGLWNDCCVRHDDDSILWDGSGVPLEASDLTSPAPGCSMVLEVNA